MQLIIKSQPTEEVKIKMSTHSENPVNGDVNNIQKELNYVSKDNNLNINDGTNVIPYKNVSNITDTDHLPSKITNETVLIEEKCQDSNGNEKLKSNQGVIDTIQKDDLIDNMNNQGSEIICNGTVNNQDKIEPECDDSDSIDKFCKEFTTTNLLTLKKNIDADIHLTSNRNKDPKSSTRDEDLMLTNECISKLELPMTKETTMSMSISVVVPEEISKAPKANTEKNLQEPKSLSEETTTVNALNTANTEEESSVKDREMSDINKQEPKIASSIEFKTINEEIKDLPSSENINALIENLNDGEINTDVNILMNTEINKPCNIPEDIALNNKEEKQNGEPILERTILAEYPNDLEVVEEMVKPSEVPVDIVINNEPNALVDDTKLIVKKIPSMDEDNLDIVAMHAIEKTCTIHNENSKLTETEKLKPKTIVEEIAPVVEKSFENVGCFSAQKEKCSLELSSLPVIEEINDTLMAGSTPTPIIEGTAAHKIEQGHDEVLENALNTLQENVELLLNSVSATKHSDEKGLVHNKKEVENDPMKIHDVEVVDLGNEKQNEDIIKSDTLSKDVCSKETRLAKVTTELFINEIIKNDETDLKKVASAPMEIDDVEIVDLDKEKDNERLCDAEITANDVTRKANNVFEIPEPESTCDKQINKSLTELLDKNLDNNDMTVTTVNTAEEPKKIEAKKLIEEVQDKVEILDEDDIKILENKLDETPNKIEEKENYPEHKRTKELPVVCKLSNTLDILSDDEEESSKVETKKTDNSPVEKQCINIDDDDDIMLIDEDSNSKEATNVQTEVLNDKEQTQSQTENKTDLETGEKNITTTDVTELAPKIIERDLSPMHTPTMDLESVPQAENIPEEQSEKLEMKKPLLPQNFLKTAKKNLADMTKNELEDFCILRIVESIVDRSNLSDIKTKMKTMAQNLEDYRKRIIMLTKQNRDLQVVLKTVQEEQKKRLNTIPIQPLKITRSVGMQVLMNDKIDARRKGPIPNQVSTIPAGRPARAVQNVKVTKPPGTPPVIPVPRKVPVSNSPAKTLTTTPTNNIVNKTASPNPNGLRNPSPVQKAPEKRTHSRMQATSSVTVDLTDDEPPTKINNKNSPVLPVRLVPPQNLLAQQRPFSQPLNSPRKVYIPISGPQSQNIRPGQTLMMKSVPPPGPRQRVPTMPRMQQSPIRINKQVTQRHPAPLPDAMKQYTPPTWKALPPAPDLKLSKVENGIVISWKIDGLESNYETIASYQLYAYQETSSPPCTALWKKIGDVKALPLPMACTLTQFMAGFKYYFAVRAVDIRSRLGPFSVPGSILLLNKV